MFFIVHKNTQGSSFSVVTDINYLLSLVDSQGHQLFLKERIMMIFPLLNQFSFALQTIVSVLQKKKKLFSLIKCKPKC